MKYKLLTMPGCDKCAALKEYLATTDIEGKEVDIAEDEGVAELREIYPKIKDKITRMDSGSVPVPMLLLFDENNNIIHILYTVDEAKNVLENKSLRDM